MFADVVVFTPLSLSLLHQLLLFLVGGSLPLVIPCCDCPGRIIDFLRLLFCNLDGLLIFARFSGLTRFIHILHVLSFLHDRVYITTCLIYRSPKNLNINLPLTLIFVGSTKRLLRTINLLN